MIYLNSFLFCGIVCLIGQIILDNTKLTPGHVTSIFTVMGAVLSFLGIYQGFFEKSPKATIRSTFPHIPKIKQIDTAHSKTSIKKAKTGAENRRFTGKY